MGYYWHRKRKQKPTSIEDGITYLLLVLIIALFYPPLRPVLQSFWYIYVIMLVIIVFTIGKNIYHRIKLSKAGIYEIDKMSGTDFEIYLSELFKKMGYSVEHTGHTGDYGSDLIIEKDGVRTAVQAKRYTEHVGPDAVREVNTVLNIRKCTRGMVVTNSYFTDEAILLAKSNNIVLKNRDDLVNQILKLQ